MMMKKATTLSILRFIVAAIIIASSSSHAFLIGTQHLNNNYSPRGGIKASSSLAETQRDEENAAVDNHRRTLLLLTSLCSCYQSAISHAADNNDDGIIATPSLPSDMISARIQGIHDPNLRNYVNPLLPHWKGTALPGPLSLSQAYSQFIRSSLSSTADDNNAVPVKTTTTVFPMGKWPDPILRIPSSQIPLSTFQDKSQLQMLQSIADTLRNTARNEGAVGLAAQQCGIDASLIFVEGLCWLILLLLHHHHLHHHLHLLLHPMQVHLVAYSVKAIGVIPRNNLQVRVFCQSTITVSFQQQEG